MRFVFIFVCLGALGLQMLTVWWKSLPMCTSQARKRVWRLAKFSLARPPHSWHKSSKKSLQTPMWPRRLRWSDGLQNQIPSHLIPLWKKVELRLLSRRPPRSLLVSELGQPVNGVTRPRGAPKVMEGACGLFCHKKVEHCCKQCWYGLYLNDARFEQLRMVQAP